MTEKSIALSRDEERVIRFLGTALETGTSVSSNVEIARGTGLSPEAVDKALARLSELGLVASTMN